MEEKTLQNFLYLSNFPKTYSSDFEKDYEIIAMYLAISLSNAILYVVSYIFLLLQ